MKHQKKVWLLPGLVVALAALAAGTGIYTYTQYGPEGGEEGLEDSVGAPGNTEDSQDDGRSAGEENGEAAASAEITEKEKQQLESQTGVTITDEGVMQIDLEEILAEESSVTVSREEAKQLVFERLGGGTEIGAVDIREYQGVKYWAVHASKGGEAYQIWLNTDTGEEFINQTE